MIIGNGEKEGKSAREILPAVIYSAEQLNAVFLTINHKFNWQFSLYIRMVRLNFLLLGVYVFYGIGSY